MIKRGLFLSVLIIRFFINTSLAAENTSEYKISLLPGIVRQGDIVAIHVTALHGLTSLSGRFNNNPVSFNKSEKKNVYIGFIGIDMTLAPGRQYLNIVGSDKGKVAAAEVEINVKKRVYGIEKLDFPENLVELDDETGRRAVMEAEALKQIWEKVVDEKLWKGRFRLPVNGKLKRNFGTRRILNGVEKNPHNGVDISAAEGTMIISPNRGRVVLVDNHFFGGKTIVLDHGQGFYTTYLHLSKISVKEGDIVNKGARIGRVGNTGRANSPHLHWSARLNNARIDPLKLLNIKDGAM